MALSFLPLFTILLAVLLRTTHGLTPVSTIWSDPRLDASVTAIHGTTDGRLFFAHRIATTAVVNRLDGPNSNYAPTHVAGGGTITLPNNVSVFDAQFSLLRSLSGTASGDILYAVDQTNKYIYKIDLVSSLVTIFLGTGACTASTPDGYVAPGTPVSLCDPYAVFVDTSSVVFYYDSNRLHLRKIDPATNMLTTVAGGWNGNIGGNVWTDVAATSVAIGLSSFIVANDGSIYGTNYFGGIIYKIATNGIRSIVPWGRGMHGVAIATDNQGNFYITYGQVTAMKTVNATGHTSVSTLTTQRGITGLYVSNEGHVFFASYANAAQVRAAFNSPVSPSWAPTKSPTRSPSRTPTWAPTRTPTVVPTRTPTADPTIRLSDTPTATPTAVPSAEPSQLPTEEPTASPTAVPSTEPSQLPTEEPTATPTAVPSPEPSQLPTEEPTASPTAVPSAQPTSSPSAAPTTFCEASCHILSKASADAAAVAAEAVAAAEVAAAVAASAVQASQAAAARAASATAAADSLSAMVGAKCQSWASEH